MRIGPLRHRVVLQQLAKTRDAWGGVAETWSDVSSAWASIERLSGGEAFASSQPQSEASVKMYIRRVAGIRSQSWRVKEGSALYNILAVLPSNRGEYLVLLCREASYEQEPAPQAPAQEQSSGQAGQEQASGTEVGDGQA